MTCYCNTDNLLYLHTKVFRAESLTEGPTHGDGHGVVHHVVRGQVSRSLVPETTNVRHSLHTFIFIS